MAVTANKDIMKTDWYFSTPVYSIEKPEWLPPAIKATDKFIDEAYKREAPKLKERKKFLGNKDYLKVKDHGMSYHSTPLNGDPGLKELESYIGATSWNLLDEWGYIWTNIQCSLLNFGYKSLPKQVADITALTYIGIIISLVFTF
jgi:hypothetical protein